MPPLSTQPAPRGGPEGSTWLLLPFALRSTLLPPHTDCTPTEPLGCPHSHSLASCPAPVHTLYLSLSPSVSLSLPVSLSLFPSQSLSVSAPLSLSSTLSRPRHNVTCPDWSSLKILLKRSPLCHSSGFFFFWLWPTSHYVLINSWSAPTTIEADREVPSLFLQGTIPSSYLAPAQSGAQGIWAARTNGWTSSVCCTPPSHTLILTPLAKGGQEEGKKVKPTSVVLKDTETSRTNF